MEGLVGELGTVLKRIQLIESVTLKHILLWSILMFLFTDILLFLFTVIHRTVADARARLYRRYYDMFTDQLVEAIYGTGKVSEPKTKIEKEALGDVCIEIARKFTGKERDIALKIALEKGIVDYYIQKTRSPFLPTKVVYYEKLGFLKRREIKDQLKHDITRTRQEWAVGRMCFALSLITEEVEDVKFLVDKLSSLRFISFKFLEFIWVNIISNFRERLEDLLSFAETYLVEGLNRKEILRAFVESCGNLRLTQTVDFVLKVYGAYMEDSIMRLSCIRALGNMNFVNFINIFKENVNHPDWRIRAVLCRFAHLCPYEEIIDDLKTLVGDKNYYVRINAGKSLLFFRDRVRHVLEELLGSEDPFIRDTVKYLLEELEVRGA